MGGTVCYRESVFGRDVDAANVGFRPGSAKKLDNGQPNRIGTPRRPPCEDAMLLVVAGQCSEQLKAFSSVEDPEHKQVRESFDVGQTQFEIWIDF